MRKSNFNPNLRARRPQQNDKLVLPSVAVADPIDGLIKTADLESDIVVEFPVWEGAVLDDRYQLTLNGDEMVRESH